jgi:hypothetical protein
MEGYPEGWQGEVENSVLCGKNYKQGKKKVKLDIK